IAETLHDEVGAILSSSKLHLQGIKKNGLDDRDIKLFDKCEELLDDGIQIVRGISHNLHSNILKEFGLNEAIRHFINKITHDSLIRSTTSLDNGYTTLNSEKDISIYRMVQELINNILKHAQPKEINIRSGYDNNQLRITISHDGKGLTQLEFEELRYRKEGLGLKSIQNRMILLKGDIIFSTGGNGYHIVISVPINPTSV
ncbi:MAG: ATP-binding protein, partial [Chitinophagaceae bacterium]